MFIGTLRFNRAMQFVFGSLAILFFLLALGDLTGIQTITQIAGLGRDNLWILSDLHGAGSGDQRVIR